MHCIFYITFYSVCYLQNAVCVFLYLIDTAAVGVILYSINKTGLQLFK